MITTTIPSRSRRRARLALLAFPLALAASSTALSGAAQAVPSRASIGTYTDPTGDSGSAPDISGVTISSAPDGQILFRITASLSSAPEAWTVLLLDTDVNEATGSPDSLGADFIFGVDEVERTYWFGRWAGADWDDSPDSTVRVFSGSSDVTISVNRSELGNTGEFNFWTRTGSGEFEEGRYDDAPDDGTWNYSLAAAGPNIEAVLVSTTPSAGPRSGRAFTVTPAGLRIKSNGGPPLLPRPDSYSCRATLAGRTLAGAGVGACSWRIPKNARRKQLKVVLTVAYQGATKSVPFVYRVS
jgi:hypothetical protein